MQKTRTSPIPAVTRFLVALLLSVLVTGQTFAKDRQAEIDDTIADLEEANRELTEDLPELREEVDELIEASQAELRELRAEDDPPRERIEFHQRMINMLQSYREPGLSLTDTPGMAVEQDLRNWMDANDMTMGWGLSGLSQLGALAKIYYTQKRIANHDLLIELLQSRRRFGMSEAEYDWYKREWEALGEREAGIRGSRGATEAVGLSARGIWAYPLYDLVGVWRETEPPEPGTEAYRQEEARYLSCLERKGVDVEALQEYQRRLSQRIRRLEPADELPGFLESIGVDDDWDAEEIADITEWRATLLRASYRHWLRMLSTCDFTAVAAGVRQQADAIGRFDQALTLAADGAITQIEATQKLTEEVLSSVPLIDDALNLYGVVSGETLSGEQVDGWSRLIEGALSLGPVGIKGLSKASPSFARALRSLQGVADRTGRAGIEALAGTLGMSPAKLQQAVEVVGEALDQVL